MMPKTQLTIRAQALICVCFWTFFYFLCNTFRFGDGMYVGTAEGVIINALGSDLSSSPQASARRALACVGGGSSFAVILNHMSCILVVIQYEETALKPVRDDV